MFENAYCTKMIHLEALSALLFDLELTSLLTLNLDVGALLKQEKFEKCLKMQNCAKIIHLEGLPA